MTLFNFPSFDPWWAAVWFLILILVWLAFREARTWYWKQTEIVDILKKIEANTQKDGIKVENQKEIK